MRWHSRPSWWRLTCGVAPASACFASTRQRRSPAAFRKGSTQSPQTQRCAMRLARAVAAADVDCLPGPRRGGHRGASRAGSELGPDANVESVLGPAVDDVVWRRAAQAAADAGWPRVTVDAFASASNARAPRFRSRFLEPRAEAIDAHCVLDWVQPFSELVPRECHRRERVISPAVDPVSPQIVPPRAGCPIVRCSTRVPAAAAGAGYGRESRRRVRTVQCVC